MPTLTVCRVVRTSVLLGPERMAQALKIILTIAAQEEVSHASRCMPASRRANKKKRIPSRVNWRRSTRTWPRTTTVLPEHIFFDNGVSGSRLDRPALDRLRDQARFGDFEAVIVLSPDRLARSYPHQWLLLEEFKKEGCRVIFMENPFGDSPHGQLLTQMQGMIAEYERSQIADRTRRGQLHKARKDEFLPWAYRVYGYRYIPKQAGLLPRVEVHPEQADVVRDMFRWLIEELDHAPDCQTVERAEDAHADGAEPRVHAASVRCMLNNPIYTGQGYYNRTKSGVPRKETRRTFHPRTDNYAREPASPRGVGAHHGSSDHQCRDLCQAQEQLKRNQGKCPPRLSAHVAAVSLADARALWAMSVAHASGTPTERLQAL